VALLISPGTCLVKHLPARNMYPSFNDDRPKTRRPKRRSPRANLRKHLPPVRPASVRRSDVPLSAQATANPYPQGTFRRSCVSAAAESSPAFCPSASLLPEFWDVQPCPAVSLCNPASRCPSVAGVRPPANECQLTAPSACAAVTAVCARWEAADPHELNGHLKPGTRALPWP
jgi:hypothetical protein